MAFSHRSFSLVTLRFRGGGAGFTQIGIKRITKPGQGRKRGKRTRRYHRKKESWSGLPQENARKKEKK